MGRWVLVADWVYLYVLYIRGSWGSWGMRFQRACGLNIGGFCGILGLLEDLISLLLLYFLMVRCIDCYVMSAVDTAIMG